MSRMIDADAMRDRLQNLADDEWNLSTPTSWAEAFTECADMVEDAPTIEPEPQRTGRWINDHCSECGQYVWYGDMRKYCPQCGARMEDKHEAD